MLKGKTAVISGGSRGIGRSIALRFAASGANIAILYSSDKVNAEATVTEAQRYGVKAKSYCCDVSDFEAVKALAADIINDFSTVDILVNNAGIVRDGLVLSMKEDDFDKVISVNLKGAFNLIRHFSSHMLKRKSGRIINITSVVALTGNPGQANYTAAKAGLIGLTKTIAREFASRGITCNAIAPGFIDTDMTQSISEQAKERLVSRIPLARTGKAEEVAGLAAFLASDDAAYITGETIRIDGGLGI
ncbi:MAG TPA: 3-oxoacyl-[acyl-carrier-protein] reductase [Clostridia bacterium]|nr:3-oxoacyl-[acyl-carrier-protein] reductase [Clostridia bacterium]